MSITREFTIPLYAEMSMPVWINVNQFDRGETWIFTILDEGGQQYTPTTGAIIGIKSDGHIIANSGTVDSSGRVVITETEQMTAAPGHAIFELVIDNEAHGTANFTVYVEPRPGENGIQSESDLSLFQEAIDAVGDALFLEQEIDVLSARMDTFTHLAEGSTTGDAELADIRVANDGVTYSTAGDSVRDQASYNFYRSVDVNNILETKQGKTYDATSNIPYHERHSSLFSFSGTFGTGNSNYYFRLTYPASMTSTGSITTVNGWEKNITLYPKYNYKLSIKLKSGSISNDIWVRVKDSTNAIIASASQGETVTFNTQYESPVMIYLHITANTAFTDSLFEISLIPVPVEYDVMIFMGQSNMAGRGIVNTDHPEDAPSVTPLSGYEFRAISDPTRLYPITKTMGVNENTSAGIDDSNKKTGSMLPAFVNAYYANTGTPIIAVSASEGGSSINGWQPNTGNLTDAISRWNTAITWLTANGFKIRHKYMAWCQGESDGDNDITVEAYKTGFNAMLAEMLTNGVEKCFMFRIGEYNGTANDYANVIQAQTEIAQSDANVVLVTANQASFKARGMMKDQFHYYQDAYNEMGTYGGVNTAIYVNTGKEPTMYDPKYTNLYYSHKN